MTRRAPALPWLEPGQDFPPVDTAWAADAPAPGLLAAGGALDAPTLRRAYAHGIFPWFSEGQPILWWSPDPRMVLQVADFRLHDSLRKQLRAGLRSGRIELRFDHDFTAVIGHCAGAARPGQHGTWILPEMVDAYTELHRLGVAHSVETWWDGVLAGGLYCVGIGQAVFGESMFSLRSNASKIALAALVAFCRAHGLRSIDCQQNTAHLGSLGAREMPRERFVQSMRMAVALPPPVWRFDSVYWDHLFHAHAT
ncbi:leucyl/phenylalanyl-tRNA--protein transferase [Hydrogenophaga sp. OTU3427]|uniref:leucyl/phenylalanyl-tRNA--protein transferase n=1 Tax=Hydrogenophaga sp. OTU3427 TaxID=3043856 RepID=UPI00313D8E40